ncbi:MAG: M23 family metallopeptidase [Ruminococcaceae bacterium]|nr:M23 family metallopeptidase [Oscillospiraceae bacterium]
MKRLSRITSLALSALMVMLSVITAYAVNTIGTAETATVSNVERMSMVEAPYPFEFVVASTEENEATISFVPGFSSGYTFYLGVKGEKTEILKINRTQYIVEADVEYAFVYTYTVGDEMTVYNGTLIVKTNEDDEITVTPTNVVKNITYAGDITSEMINSNSLAGMRAAGTVWESENNNVMSNADITYDDYDNYGYISSLNDVDWWKIEFDEGGMANFWLGNIPYECDYDLYLYDEYSTGDSDYLATSQNFHGVSELIQYSVEAGVKYYVKINTYDEFSNSSAYLFRAKNYRNIGSDEFGFYVYDADTLEPIPGASVYAYRPKTYYDSYPVPTAQITNLSGEVYFSKTILPFYDQDYTGGYGIIIKAPGYAQYTSPQYVFSGTERQNIALVSKDSYPDFNSPFDSNEECTTPSMSANQHWGWRYLVEDIDYHTGVDIGKIRGTNLYTVTNSGTVKISSYATGAGNYVIIQSGSYYIAYLHMDTKLMSAGQIFTERTQVGTVGNTETNDYHLHISVGTEQTIQISARSYLDPLAFLPFE